MLPDCMSAEGMIKAVGIELDGYACRKLGSTGVKEQEE